MSEKPKKRPGPVSLFRGKRRAPVSLTLTPEHHEKVETARRRLGVTRADLLALLIENHASTVTLPANEPAYRRLRNAVEALGGTLENRKFGGPRGETWVLELGRKRLVISLDGSKRFALLDACYRPVAGDVPRARDENVDDIDPAGLAELLKALVEAAV